MLKTIILVAAALCSAAANAEAPVESVLPLEHGSFAVDGRALSFFCTGEGAPTLVLEAPSGLSNQEAYATVLPMLADDYRVCAYERAAYGGSPPLPSGMVQSLNDYARELRHFVALDAVPKPVLLIGYSYGGFVARYHAAHHPEQVRGIVLIDTPHAHWMRRMKAQLSPDDWAKVTDILQWFVENRGHDAWISSFEMEAAPPLPRDLPVAVITRALDHERMLLSGISQAGYRVYNDLHYELAPQLLKLTERTRGFTATKSQHFVPDTEPGLVVEAVEAVVTMSAQQ